MSTKDDDLKIDYTYDSHVHFFGTGIPAIEWDLKTQEKVPKHLLDKPLIRGFGWNDETYFLDEIKKYDSNRFFLSKIDGHTAFITSNLINDLNIDPNDFTKVGSCGFILKEHERDFIERLLPKRTSDDLRKMALFAQEIFKSKQITKVRHLTCTGSQWKTLENLENEGLIHIEIECFFSEFMDQTFEEAIEAFVLAKESVHLKPKGLKVFYDGSFGSHTAYSFLFPEVKPRISFDQLKNRIEVALELESDIAIHTIGEKAVEESLKAFKESQSNLKGHKTNIHLEHCPALSQLSLDLINELKPTLHFQPSHYVGDKLFLEKLRDKGFNIYPFHLLKTKNTKFHFGSDSPVTNPLSPSQHQEVLKLFAKA